MQLDKIKQKLEALKRAQENKPSGGGNREFDNILWSPKETGKYQIRILPNKFQPEYPYVELNLYYGNFGKTYCSPSSFDRPDPVIDYCNALLDPSKKLPKDEWMVINNIKKKLLPTQRVFVPILVRGKESEGVKIWGFSQKVYMQLLEISADEDYGNIEDLQRGTDLTIDFVKDPNDSRQNKTSILPKRNASIATDDPDVLAKIDEMPNPALIFPEPTYDELKGLLKKYLDDSARNEQPPVERTQEESTRNTKNVTANQSETEKFDHSGFKPPVAPTEESKGIDVSDIEAEFERMLNSK